MGVAKIRESFIENRRVMRKVLASRPKSRQRFVWGLDPSLSGTGITILSKDGRDLYEKEYAGDVSCLTTDPKAKRYARMDYIQQQVSAKLASHQPLLLVMEDYAYGAKLRRELLGEVGGVIRMALWQHNVPVILAAPLQLKKFLTGKGGGSSGSKSAIMMEVLDKYGVKTENDNEADSYVLARIALALVQYFGSKACRYGSSITSKKLINHMKKMPVEMKELGCKQYQWEVVVSLVLNKGGRVADFIREED